MDQQRPLRGVPHDEPGLLVRLAQGGLPRCFTAVNVPARLEPDSQALVQVQDHAPPADDNGRTRHVHSIGLLVEGVLESRELFEENLDRRSLAFVYRDPLCYCKRNALHH